MYRGEEGIPGHYYGTMIRITNKNNKNTMKTKILFTSNLLSALLLTITAGDMTVSALRKIKEV
jgi:hypothetical protein